MNNSVMQRLEALRDAFRENGEEEIAAIYDTLLAGESIGDQLRAVPFWSLFGLAGSFYVGFAGAQEQEEAELASVFCGLAMTASVAVAERIIEDQQGQGDRAARAPWN